MPGYVTDVRLMFELLPLLAEGMDNVEIGRKLHLSRHAVKNRLSSLLLHLGARNRVHAVALAYERGLLPPRVGEDHAVARRSGSLWTVVDGGRVVAEVFSVDGRVRLNLPSRSPLDPLVALDLRRKLGAAINLALDDAAGERSS